MWGVTTIRGARIEAARRARVPARFVDAERGRIRARLIQELGITPGGW
jgi:hypothetical protein